jgi:hypothetical protein
MSHHVGKQSTTDLVAFAHATLFSPSLSTLEKALNNGYLTNFPGLNAQSLRKFPPASAPKAKGHLDQTPKNQGSTQQGTHIEPDRDNPINGTDDFTPPADTPKRSDVTAQSQRPLDKSILTSLAASSHHLVPATTI